MPKQLSHLQKLQVVEEAAETRNVKKTAAKWNVHPSTIRKWRNNYEKIMSLFSFDTPPRRQRVPSLSVVARRVVRSDSRNNAAAMKGVSNVDSVRIYASSCYRPRC